MASELETRPAERRRDRSASPRPQPADADLAAIQALYDDGRVYDAFRRAREFAPLREWRSADARILAGRLAHHLGAPVMADGLMLLAWRRAPDHLQARYYGLHALLSRRGPLEALHRLEQYETPAGDPISHAEWLALEGNLLAMFRDFARSEALLDEAQSIAPDHHWIALQRSALMLMQDRLDEALAEAHRGFELQPRHPGGTLSKAQCLTLLGRTEDAIDALQTATQTIQSAPIAAALAGLLTEQGRYGEALDAWQLCEVLMPLLEKRTKEWLYINLSHVQYLVGNLEESKRLAVASGNQYAAKFSERIDASNSASHRRWKLEVPFLRQHYVTCVPTTMAMLGRFWGEDLEHLAIAEQITYGGTAVHRARKWAETHGWVVRDFTVTWETAVALLDRGVPFALTTTGGDASHEQAVAGYDTHRRTLLIRDPSSPGISEGDFESLAESQRASGPQATVMVPRSEAPRIEGIALPEAAERDILQDILLALDVHDRAAADALAGRLPDPSGTGAGVRITLAARQAMAIYDHDSAALLRWTDAALALDPSDAQLLMQKQRALAQLSRTEERKTFLHQLATGDKIYPLFLRVYAEALSESAAENERATGFLRRYFRQHVLDPEALRLLGNIAWDKRQFDDATDLYRLASSLGETNEQLANAFFIASTSTGRTEEALEFLRDRARRARARSSQPTRTLFRSLEHLYRVDEAFEELGRAMALRPEDGDLALFAAEWYARFSRDGAEQLLDRAEPHTRKADFLGARARIHAWRGELQSALSDWRQVFELEPLNVDAHHGIRELLEQVEGRAAVVEFLERLIERFPGYRPAHALFVEITSDADRARHEEAIRRMLALAPNDAWAHRELAIHLAVTGRFDEALAEVAVAEAIAPMDVSSANVRGRVLMLAGRPAEARSAFEAAVEMAPDEAYAISMIGGTVAAVEERRALYEHLFERIVARSSYGNGILAWFDAARFGMMEERIAALTAAARAQRAELWQAHAISIRHFVAVRNTAEAVAAADEATARFPSQPAIWLDAAAAYGLAGDRARQAGALESALRLDSRNSDAATALAGLCHANGEDERAIAVLTTAAAAAPLDPSVQWMLGLALRERGETERALRHLARAASLSPGDDGLWRNFSNYASEAGERDLPNKTAARLIEEKPGSAAAWLTLASLESELDRRLAAIDRAIEVDHSSIAAWDRKAAVLAEAGRFADAIDTCSGPHPERPHSFTLRGREAWVLARKGDLNAAIEKMTAVVRDEPGYAWGWYQLCFWYSDAGDAKKYRAAAAEFVHASPDAVVAWNSLADAELLLGNRKAAEEALRRALQIEPKNAYAALTMVDLHLEAGRIARAVELLDAAEPASHPPEFRLRRLDVAIRNRDRAALGVVFGAMASDNRLDEEPVAEAIRRLQAARLYPEVRGFLEEAARGATINGGAAAEYVRLMLDTNQHPNALALIDRMLRRGEAAGAATAAVAFLEKCGEKKVRWPIDDFGRAFPGWTAQETRVWAAYGYAELCLRSYHSCISSMRDWANRDGLRPYMLLNLALAYRYTGKDAEAALVNEFAIGLPADGSTEFHRVWMAFDDAVAGKGVEANRRMSAVQFDQLNRFHQFIGRMVWAYVVAWREHKEGKPWRQAAGRQLQMYFDSVRGERLQPLAKSCFRKIVNALSAQFAKSWADRVWILRMRLRQI